ncbi:siphovirus Gp157 family protein [Virgibacillus sp. C22-A2]|uniref:Siphovirus Gp157 family protein n=1 Tax=Virgibacillus tibetensis TaxID=3042313 RepID=A0ABU6KAB1_9BACI|nr:siphovirus Gp157 family protein [Virgibacillus sp. C22-A2]
MTTLYDLTHKYKRLLELAEEVDAGAFQDALEGITEGINSKAENIAYVLQQMKSDADVLRAEEKRLAERRRALESKQDHLKFYLFNELDGLGIEKVQSPHFTISIRNNPPKVQIEDESLIPSDFIITKSSVDKKALKQAIKDGREFEGVSMISERGLNIR